jgi:hypothetical protein
MEWPLVSRRRYNAVNADRERIRGERDQFAKDRDAFKYAAESATEKYTDTAIVNEILTEDLSKAREELAAATAGKSGDAVAAELAAALERAELLQAELDDARLVASRLTALVESRQQLDDQQRPIDAATPVRREPTSTRLRRERERVRKLEEIVRELQASHVADTRELHDLRQGAAS